MGSIQTSIRDDRGEIVELTPNDARYWEGPYRYEPFPKALYRVTEPGQKKADIAHVIVKSQAEMDKLSADWKESHEEARAHYAALEADMAKAAAEANFAASKMSAKAQDEFTAHARSTDAMTTDVPAPKKRAGRPKKLVTPAVE